MLSSSSESQKENTRSLLLSLHLFLPHRRRCRPHRRRRPRRLPHRRRAPPSPPLSLPPFTFCPCPRSGRGSSFPPRPRSGGPQIEQVCPDPRRRQGLGAGQRREGSICAPPPPGEELVEPRCARDIRVVLNGDSSSTPTPPSGGTGGKPRVPLPCSVCPRPSHHGWQFLGFCPGCGDGVSWYLRRKINQ